MYQYLTTVSGQIQLIITQKKKKDSIFYNAEIDKKQIKLVEQDEPKAGKRAAVWKLFKRLVEHLRYKTKLLLAAPGESHARPLA